MTAPGGPSLYLFRMRLPCAILVLAVLGASAAAAEGGPPTGRSVYRLPLHAPGADHVNYLLYVPPAYGDQPSAAWPLIVFLHGSEQRGDDPSLLAGMEPLVFADQQTDFPFIVVVPQCPPGTDWQPPMVKSVLDTVEANLRIDRSRVYLTGFSMGGLGTWQTAASFPGTFAAIAPLCGLSDIADVPRLKGLPIWVFHGAQDRNVPVSESLRMVAALRDADIDASLTVYPHLAHDCWTATYGDSRLYFWFLEHSLAGAGVASVDSSG